MLHPLKSKILSFNWSI